MLKLGLQTNGLLNYLGAEKRIGDGKTIKRGQVARGGEQSKPTGEEGVEGGKLATEGGQEF